MFCSALVDISLPVLKCFQPICLSAALLLGQPCKGALGAFSGNDWKLGSLCIRLASLCY